MEIGMVICWAVWYLIMGLVVNVASGIAGYIYAKITYARVGADFDSVFAKNRMKELRESMIERSRKLNVPVLIRVALWPIFLGIGFIWTINDVDQVRNEILEIRKNVE